MANTKKHDKLIAFEEKDLSFWELGFMLSAGQGIISMGVGVDIAQKFGLGTAMTSILIGNFILFFIGLGIISMTGQRSHTIQNIKENFKPYFTFILAVIIVALFLLWYALHTKQPTFLITNFLTSKLNIQDVDSTFVIRVGSILGLTCALACMWGITLIKWVNIITFPIQILFFVLAFLTIKSTGGFFENTWGFSFIGTLQVMLTWLPGTVNMSTFSRHSRSRAHSILSLFFIFTFHSLFQCMFLMLENRGVITQIFNSSSMGLVQIIAFIFVIVSFFAVNFLNIYWASIGWETFFKKEQGAKGYAVIGLLGTVIYIFFESSQLVLILEKISTALVANLGMVLISSALVKLLIQHRVRPIDRIDNAICWVVGSAAALYAYFTHHNGITAAIYGINTTLLMCGLIIFLEEFYWSAKKIKI